jgi:hypothetical protein
LTAARSREDDAHIQLELLRQRQRAESPPRAEETPAPAIAAERPIETPPQHVAANPSRENSDKMLEQLLLLRLELSRLLANCTDEHPQIVTLRKQISGIERQLRLVPSESPQTAPSGPNLLPPSAGQQHSRSESSQDGGYLAGQYVVAAAAPLLPDGQGGLAGVDRNSASGQPWHASQPTAAEQWSAELKRALEILTQTSRERQLAEQRLGERMQQLAAQPSAAQWSAGPAHVVTRLGGTPRSSTMALGGLLAGIAGIALFRAAPHGSSCVKIDMSSELASALELPIVGNLSSLRSTAARLKRSLLTPSRVSVLVHVSEAIVAIAVAACLVAIAVDPSLGRQVLADPFGTLSEELGRIMR